MYIKVPVTWLNFLRAVEGVEDKSSRFAIEIIHLAGGANTTKQTFDRATCQSPEAGRTRKGARGGRWWHGERSGVTTTNIGTVYPDAHRPSADIGTAETFQGLIGCHASAKRPRQNASVRFVWAVLG
ncbi:hypothetical protein B0H16DRAFT_1458857 [Mycena metata]|uniref:Uncharacterized protein n=1 Tax=Mycena metata TaxID=1033252 RepID=A0AAD7J115_9AGAR|nr:hypothetical protein B0H16DRAFT_1458857 [Mycena metata]